MKLPLGFIVTEIQHGHHDKEYGKIYGKLIGEGFFLRLKWSILLIKTMSDWGQEVTVNQSPDWMKSMKQ